MTPKISIIMPMYGVEAYIGQSIKSVQNQTFTEWELLIVNDGTKDGSREIAAAYVQNDSRIRIIDKENGGLTSARLRGLREARGNYISFVDSDDTLAPDYLEVLYTNIREYDADISMCSYNVVQNGVVTGQKLYFQNQTTVIQGASIFSNYILPQISSVKKGVSFLPSFMWLRLIKKDILSENLFVSERVVYQEDLVFSLRISNRLGKVVVVNLPLYNYFVNNGSLTQRYRSNAWEMMQVLTTEIKQVLYAFPKANTKERLYSRTLCAVHFILMNAAYLDFRSFKKEFSRVLAEQSVRDACKRFSLINIKRCYWVLLISLWLHSPYIIYNYNKKRLLGWT